MNKASSIVLGAARGVRIQNTPPTYREFAKRIKLPGTRAGEVLQWDPRSDPVQDWLVDQIDSGQWEMFGVCASPQTTGKTQTLVIGPALWRAIGCGMPIGYALPTLQDLDKQWADKIKPAIEAAGFAAALPTHGPGARGGRAPSLQLYDPETGHARGRLTFFAGTAYSSTVSFVPIDEGDQFRSKDGTPDLKAIGDIFSRCDRYKNQALRIIVGTIETNDRDKCIVLLYAEDQGTGHRPWMACPACGEYQSVCRDQLRYAEDAKDEEEVWDTARIVCSHCGDCTSWDENARQKSLRNVLMVAKGQSVEDGRIVGDAPRTKKLGLVWSSFAAVRSDLREMAVKHWHAAQMIEKTGNHELMSTFVRYQCCECYTDDIQEDGQAVSLTPQIMVARGNSAQAYKWQKEKTSEYSRYICDKLPPNINAAGIACDIQGNRIYWHIIGSDGRNTYDLACGTEHMPRIGDRLPSLAGADWGRLLDRIDSDVCSLLNVPLVHRVMDTGYEPDELAKWMHDHRGTWRGIRGHTSMPAKHTVKIPGLLAWEQNWRAGMGRYWIVSRTGIAAVHAAYMARITAEGAAIPPAGESANLAFFRHMCSWVDEGGKWKKILTRDDFLDCRSYNQAMMQLHERRSIIVKHTVSYGAVGTL